MSTSDNPSQLEGGQESRQQSVQKETSQQESEKQRAVAAARDAASLPPATVIRIYVILGLIAGLWYLLKHPEVRLLSSVTWWWLAVTGVVALVLVLLFLPYTRKWLGPSTATRSAGYVIYGVIPAVVALVVGIGSLSGQGTNVLRVVFLAIVILLPATMYYLFIATRKVSLLNEFINNLDRLGLLTVQKGPGVEISSEERARLELIKNRRLESYRRKFEALYGPVSDDDLRKALFGLESNPATMQSMVGPGKDSSFFTSETAIPVVTASILVALGWILILPLKQRTVVITDWLQILEPEKSAVYFAFLGAYFFSLQMLFRRYVLRDLRPSAYVAVAMRIILAVVGTWVVAIITKYRLLELNQQTLLVVGFAIGVFPSLAWQFVQAALKKITFAGFFIPSLSSQLPISDLDGLTVWHEARLEEEDVENVPNMATADLVDLMLQTRFSPDRIIDWVDQAILFTHIGPEKTANGEPGVRKRLREQGIRTATSLVEVYRKAHEAGDVEAFEKILPAGDSGRTPIRGLADAVQTNPNFRIIWIWRGLPDEQYKSVTASAKLTERGDSTAASLATDRQRPSAAAATA
jgi:uncharacterized membrane protein